MYSRNLSAPATARARHASSVPEYGRLVLFLAMTVCVGAAQGYLLMLFDR